MSAVATSCGRSEAKQREMYYITKTYSFTIVPSEAPPHAREDITYKVFIRDRDTREPSGGPGGKVHHEQRTDRCGEVLGNGEAIAMQPDHHAPQRQRVRGLMASSVVNANSCDS